jgi:hypothetical protein
LEEEIAPEGSARSLARRMDLGYALWIQGSDYRKIPIVWIQDILGKGLYANVALWKPNTERGKYGWCVSGFNMKTDQFLVPTSDRRLRLFPGNIQIPPEILERTEQDEGLKDD